MSAEASFRLAEPRPSFIKIVNPLGRTLLSLDISGERLTASFDEADLDEAALRFVEGLTSLKVVR